MSSRLVAQEWAKGWPKLAQIQKASQTNSGYIHRRFSSDRVTSFLIPAGMSAVATAMLVPGLFSMYLGINKTE